MQKKIVSAVVYAVQTVVCIFFWSAAGFAAPASSDVSPSGGGGSGDVKPNVVMSVGNYEFDKPARDFDYTQPVDLGNILSFVSGYLQRASDAYLEQEKSNATRAVVDRGAARMLTERYPLTRFVMFGAQDPQKVIDLLRSEELQKALARMEKQARDATCYKLLHEGSGAGGGGGGGGTPGTGKAGSGGISQLDCKKFNKKVIELLEMPPDELEARYTRDYRKGKFNYLYNDPLAELLLGPGARVTDGYGWRGVGHMHHGIDIGGVPIGTPIRLPFDGQIEDCHLQTNQNGVEDPLGGGYITKIRLTNGKYIRVMHQMKGSCEKARELGKGVLKAGTIIGYVGDTGAGRAHLHIEQCACKGCPSTNFMAFYANSLREYYKKNCAGATSGDVASEDTTPPPVVSEDVPPASGDVGPGGGGDNGDPCKELTADWDRWDWVRKGKDILEPASLTAERKNFFLETADLFQQLLDMDFPGMRPDGPTLYEVVRKIGMLLTFMVAFFSILAHVWWRVTGDEDKAHETNILMFSVRLFWVIIIFAAMPNFAALSMKFSDIVREVVAGGVNGDGYANAMAKIEIMMDAGNAMTELVTRANNGTLISIYFVRFIVSAGVSLALSAVYITSLFLDILMAFTCILSPFIIPMCMLPSFGSRYLEGLIRAFVTFIVLGPLIAVFQKALLILVSFVGSMGILVTLVIICVMIGTASRLIDVATQMSTSALTVIATAMGASVSAAAMGGVGMAGNTTYKGVKEIVKKPFNLGGKGGPSE